MKCKQPSLNKQVGLAQKVVTSVCIAHMACYSSLTIGQDLTLPTQGVVVQGQATIEQTAGTMQIHQLTNRSIINWQTFNIGQHAVVNFNQPSSSAVMLNRVTGNTSSQILGNLNANGQIFLLNASGVYFGGGANVNVGALVASTQSINDTQFMSDQYLFQQNQSGVIVNDGTINGGYLALIAPQITNTGSLSASQGDVVLASGENVALNVSPSGRINVSMTESEAQSLIQNTGTVVAQQAVQFKVNAVQTVVDQSINAPDSIDQLVTTNGVVRMVRSTGTIQAEDITLAAGSGSAFIDGTLDVSQADGIGGTISISGVETEIGADAYLNAQGTLGGGNIYVGGQWQGQGTMQQALYTSIAPGAILDASATVLGDGGTIVAWSDITHSLAKTYANGQFIARGGPQGGSGGQIETSGHYLNTAGIGIDAHAPMGANGLWFIDPYDIAIVAADADLNVLGVGVNQPDGTYAEFALIAPSYGYGPAFVAGSTSTLYADQLEAALDNGLDVSISTGSSYENAITFYADINSNNSYNRPGPNSDDAGIPFRASLTLTAGKIDFWNHKVTSTTHKLDLILNATEVLNFDVNQFLQSQNSYFYGDPGKVVLNLNNPTNNATQNIIGSITNETNIVTEDTVNNTTTEEKQISTATVDAKVMEIQKVAEKVMEDTYRNESDTVVTIDDVNDTYSGTKNSDADIDNTNDIDNTIVDNDGADVKEESTDNTNSDDDAVADDKEESTTDDDAVADDKEESTTDDDAVADDKEETTADDNTGDENANPLC